VPDVNPSWRPLPAAACHWIGSRQGRGEGVVGEKGLELCSGIFRCLWFLFLWCFFFFRASHVSPPFLSLQGLDVALFTGLANASVEPYLLSTQYRMHPAIAAFPSACFYQGQITDGVRAADRAPIPGFSWPRRDFPLCFIPTSPHAREVSDGTSHSNPREGEEVMKVISALLSASSDRLSLRPEDIGVVTPYAAQVLHVYV